MALSDSYEKYQEYRRASIFSIGISCYRIFLIRKDVAVSGSSAGQSNQSGLEAGHASNFRYCYYTRAH